MEGQDFADLITVATGVGKYNIRQDDHYFIQLDGRVYAIDKVWERNDMPSSTDYLEQTNFVRISLIEKDVKELKRGVADIQTSIDELKQMIMYLPGLGLEYQKLKADFDQMKKA